MIIFGKTSLPFVILSKLPKPSVEGGNTFTFICYHIHKTFMLHSKPTSFQDIFTITSSWAYKWLFEKRRKYLKDNWMPTQSWLSHKNQPWCIPTKILCNKNHIINMQRSYIKVECNKQNMVETQEPTKLQFIKNTLQKLSKWYHVVFKPKLKYQKVM